MGGCKEGFFPAEASGVGRALQWAYFMQHHLGLLHAATHRGNSVGAGRAGRAPEMQLLGPAASGGGGDSSFLADGRVFTFADAAAAPRLRNWHLLMHASAGTPGPTWRASRRCGGTTWTRC